MPLQYLSNLTARPRTQNADLHIGILLTFVAGALNAGGFLAIGQYTSHITGMVSAFADQVVLHDYRLAGIAVVSWLAFSAGAATTALVVNYLRRMKVRNLYALPLLIESALILLFGTFGGTLRQHVLADVSLAVITLCYTMGLQNALITKISHAQIRTTHLTGLTTDMGIEIGKLLYWNTNRQGTSRFQVRANFSKLRIHAALISAFVAGGLAGAYCFTHAGFISTVPLALTLAVVSLAPSFLDNRVKEHHR